MRAVVIGLAMIAGLGLDRVGAGNGGRDRADIRLEQQEATRLTAHFDSVIAELRDARVDHLSFSQQRARASLIDWLRDYRDAGRFPRNDRFTRPTPFFRDASGTPCAMAYLIARSGRTDIVDRVASAVNNAYIDDLRDDQELARWADSTGLTLAEAARVQPDYRPPERPSIPYVATSTVVGAVTVASMVFNAVEPTPASGWWGLLAGGTSVALGRMNHSEPGRTGRLANANLLVGVASVALGIRGFLHKADTTSVGRRTPDPTRKRSVAINPVVIPGGRRGGIGIGVGATF